MSYTVPTPQVLRDRQASALSAALPGADARARRSIESALVRMWALGLTDLYAYGAWCAAQTNVSSCDGDTLDQVHGPIWGVTRKQPLSAAGPVTFTGNANATVPAGTRLTRSDGAVYALSADTPFGAATSATGTVTALTAGAVGNTVIGTTLTLATTIANVGSTAVVANDGTGNGLSGGADLEADAAFRGRILLRIQAPPHGGRASDYLEWALAVPGVTRAWVLPGWLGPGTVGVTAVCDGQAGGIAPSAATVAAMQAAIAGQRPVCAAVTCFAPTLNAVNLTVALNPNTVANQTAAVAAIADFLFREAAPGGTLYFSRLSANIQAAGAVYRLQMTSPTGDVLSAPGVLPVLGTIAWGAYP